MDLQAQLDRERQRSRAIQDVARAVGTTLDLDRLLNLIVTKLTVAMDADRSTLYLMDSSGSELWTKVLQADELKEIRLRVGQGIAGWVAETGQVVNIEDAYHDPRFNPDVDQRSGYRTRTILCAPMRDNRGHITGVVQVLNKKQGSFSADDEDMLQALASHASLAIENSKLYQSLLQQNIQLLDTQQKLERRARELDLLLEVERQIAVGESLDLLLDGLLASTTELIGAEASSILLRDSGARRLYFSSVVGEKSEAVKTFTVAVGEGICGWVAKEGRPAIINDPASDPRHLREIAQQIDYMPRNMLCVPLMSKEGSLGAIELLNKVGADQFGEQDLTLLTLVAGRVARAIELSRAKEEQIKQRNLASIGQMLSGVLHDLKTPMTIVSGYAQLMSLSDQLDSRSQYCDQILKQFAVMSAMTREVLAFARGETNMLIRKVFLHRFLKDVREHLEHEFEGKGVKLVLQEGYRGVAFLDEGKFRRVIHNIARNAVEAMPRGGTFTISVTATERDLIFTFSDTGQGIAPEMEGRMFEAFATAGKEDGTGLGLAIVHKIVTDHEGRISYESRPGEGTTFVITLPLKRAYTTSAEWPGLSTGSGQPAS